MDKLNTDIITSNIISKNNISTTKEENVKNIPLLEYFIIGFVIIMMIVMVIRRLSTTNNNSINSNSKDDAIYPISDKDILSIIT